MPAYMNPLEAAQHRFEEQELPFPYIPPVLQPNVVEISEWVYGTRPDAPDPYNLAYFSQEVMTQPVEDYVLLGHSGHGLNSYAIHYYLVKGPLALFLQLGWGGVYEDRKLERDNIIITFQTAETLIKTLEQPQYSDRFPPGTRLVIEDSSFYGSRWVQLNHLITPDSTFDLNSAWNNSVDALRDVLTFIDA